MTVFKDHPDWNELAALTDRGSDGARPELMEHLAACPACLAAWSAAVEARDRELAALDAAAAELPRGSSVSRRRSWPQPHRLAWGLGGLAAAALLFFDFEETDSDTEDLVFSVLSLVGLINNG